MSGTDPFAHRVPLKLINGGGSIIEIIDHVGAQAKDGELEAVVIMTCTVDGFQYGHIAYREGMEFAWARICASAQSMSDGLLREGL